MEDIGEGPVALDTPVFIYFMEEHPRFLPLLEPLFRALDDGTLLGVTSAVSLLETLVVPYRESNIALAERYESILGNSRGLIMLDIGRPLIRSAASLRASHGLKTPDALQLAAALRADCSAFVTNDRALPSSDTLPVLQLGDYLPG